MTHPVSRGADDRQTQEEHCQQAGLCVLNNASEHWGCHLQSALECSLAERQSTVSRTLTERGTQDHHLIGTYLCVVSEECFCFTHGKQERWHSQALLLQDPNWLHVNLSNWLVVTTPQATAHCTWLWWPKADRHTPQHGTTGLATRLGATSSFQVPRKKNRPRLHL